jgi:hypothetical protein
MIWIVLTILVAMVGTKTLILMFFRQTAQETRIQSQAEKDLAYLMVLDEVSRNYDSISLLHPLSHTLPQDGRVGIEGQAYPGTVGRSGWEKPKMESWLMNHAPESPLTEAILREDQEIQRNPVLRPEVDFPENPGWAQDVGLR